MLSKIRKILFDRYEHDLESDKWMHDTKNKDIEGKLDAISCTMISLKSIIRSLDDRLLMELFDAQQVWHQTSVDLLRANQELNKRIIELERLIRAMMVKNK